MTSIPARPRQGGEGPAPLTPQPLSVFFLLFGRFWSIRLGPSSTGGLAPRGALGSWCHRKISREINEEAKFSSSSWRRPVQAVPGPAELADVV